jgi:hypothetical protein
MTRGLEMIAAVAEKVDLHLGSRAVDLFRGNRSPLIRKGSPEWLAITISGSGV